MKCRICPHSCGVDRKTSLGVCRAPDVPQIALASLHHWEEPAISGTQGSGTIFFSHCNLACAFCQNWDISQGAGDKPGQVRGQEVTFERLREIAFELKAQGAHNINLVSPTPYSEMIREALLPVKQKLGIPVVWNSNAFELVSTLRSLELLVDVYLPDLKFHSPEVSKRYCGTWDYFGYAGKAIEEMWRQKKDFRLQNSDCRMQSGRQTRSAPSGSTIEQGVIIRHLVIPGQVEDSKRILGWIADNIGTEVHISLMAQYTPVHQAIEHAEVNRRLRRSEYDAVCDYFEKLGFENGWVQELTSASSEYTPDFDLKGV